MSGRPMTKNEQARADAIADATTLAHFLEDDVLNRPQLSHVDGPLLATLDDPRHAAKVASAVARRAFRAVPELKS